MTLDTNTVVASFFFVGCLVVDALTAMDVRSIDGVGDVASSLRASGLVLALCVASPSITSSNLGIDGTVQSIVLFVALAAVAALGLHRGGTETRAADAFFTLCIGGGAVYFVGRGGIDELTLQADLKGELNSKRRASATATAGGFLLYANARLFRAAAVHVQEVRDFRVLGPENANGDPHFVTRGHAHASLKTTLFLSFGAAVGIGAAALLISKKASLAYGLSSKGTDVPTLAGLCGSVQLVAAIVGHMASSEQTQNLNALFGAGACVEYPEYCKNTFEARRFAVISNNPVGAMFMSAIGLLVLAYPENARPVTWSQWSSYKWPLTSLIFAGIGAVVIATTLVGTLTFTGSDWYTDVFGTAILLGAFLTIFYDTQIGSVVYLAGLGADYVMLIHTYGWKEISVYFTHVTHFAESALLLLHVLLSSIVDGVYRSDVLNGVVGGITVVGTSMSMALFLLSLSLTVAGTTQHMSFRTTMPRSSLVWLYQHYVPVFVWGALYSCRCEVAFLDRVGPSVWLRAMLWFLSVPFLMGVYVLVLRYIESDMPGYDAFDTWPMVAAFSGMVMVPWIGASVI